MCFAFGKSEHDWHSGPNFELAKNTVRLREKYLAQSWNVVIVAQLELAEILQDMNIPVDLIIKEKIGVYLNSEGFVDEAAAFLRTTGVKEVIPVAQRFLHIFKCMSLIRAAGFTLRIEWITYIGFDPHSEQSWTRSRWALFVYTLQKILRIHKHKPSS